ncbi:MAG TPA: MdtA/MuxA family multidrug efflux RND transporter periplasmic adaptor subunit [Stellaceae bacterium]
MDDQHNLDPEIESRKAALVRRRRRRTRIAAWSLLFVALLAGAAWYYFRPHEAAAPQPQTARAGRYGNTGPMPVGAATAERGDMPIQLSGLGTVTPLATVTVRTQINGQLVQVFFREGQTVQKGDPLAEIDPRPYQLALDQAQGALLRDQALLANAQIDLARYQTLLKQDSIARQQVDTQQALVRQYEGTVRADQAQVDNAKLNLVYCHITSPVSGRVGLRQVDAGNYVQTGDANGIVVITQMKPITVIFSLPEDNLPAIMKRLHAGATLPVTAFDRSGTTKLATGTLATVDNQIDTSTGTVKLRGQFDNEDEALFPNQFVNVQLLVDTLHDATIIPTSAIQRGAQGTFVYEIKPDDSVTARTIKVGPTDGERVAVTAGLEPGGKVVVDGADKLREGTKVTIPAAKGAGNAARNAGDGDAGAAAHQGQPAQDAAAQQAQPDQTQPGQAQPGSDRQGGGRRHRNGNGGGNGSGDGGQ